MEQKIKQDICIGLSDCPVKAYIRIFFGNGGESAGQIPMQRICIANVHHTVSIYIANQIIRMQGASCPQKEYGK